MRALQRMKVVSWPAPRHSQPSPKMAISPPCPAARPDPASLSSSCWGQAGGASQLLGYPNLHPVPPGEQGSKGFFHAGPFWPPSPRCGLGPSPVSLGRLCFDMAARLRHVTPALRQRWGTSEGQAVIPEHHHIDIILGLHLQRGFLVNWSPCMTIWLPQSLGTPILRLKAFCKPFSFVINCLQCFKKVIWIVLCCC